MWENDHLNDRFHNRATFFFVRFTYSLSLSIFYNNDKKHFASEREICIVITITSEHRKNLVKQWNKLFSDLDDDITIL